MIEEILKTTVATDIIKPIALCDNITVTVHQSHKLKIRAPLYSDRPATLSTLNKDEYITIYKIDSTDDVNCYTKESSFLGSCTYSNSEETVIAILTYHEYKNSIECKLFVFDIVE